jgi:TonB-dependent SusC/RagA subfamily outer membrane receptor
MLDGVRVTPTDVHELSAADIASVEVVKGAAATRLYGTPDAANGVVNITTKK